MVISEELQWARFGETGRVECIVHSVPKPTGISWYKDLKILDVDAQDRYGYYILLFTRNSDNTMHLPHN